MLDLTAGNNDRLYVERHGTVIGEISWAKKHIFAIHAHGECLALVRPVPDARWWKAFPGDFAVEGTGRANLGTVTRPRTGRSPLRSWAFVLELAGSLDDPLRTLVVTAPFVMSRALHVEIAKERRLRARDRTAPPSSGTSDSRGRCRPRRGQPGR